MSSFPPFDALTVFQFDQRRVTQVVLFNYDTSIPWADLEHHFAELSQLKSTFLEPVSSRKLYAWAVQIGKTPSWRNFVENIRDDPRLCPGNLSVSRTRQRNNPDKSSVDPESISVNELASQPLCYALP